MQEAKRMQEQLMQELEELTVEASAGGGMVTVTMNGHKKVLSVTISKEVVDPNDVEMLQDLILAALNEANRKVEDEMKSKLGGIGGALGIPGLF